MRKFKRMIALVTVALFVLAFAAPAGAATFSDVSGASSDSIYRLNALGIIEGYPDGSFKPDNNITRAEFAKIAMAAAGNASSADFLKNAASKFSDVKPGEWYTGWVNLAASLGYIQGYPDGTFKPQNNITYAECVTILVRLLGYSDKLPGEWPTEYLVKAAELGITDDVAFSASAAATRGDIAMMTSETLDQNVVVWDKDVDDFVFKKDADENTYTLLADKFDGAVYDEDDYRVTAWEVDSDGQFQITISGNPFGEESTTSEDLVLAEDAVVDGGMVVPYLKNHLINFIYNADDEEVTYIDVVSTKIKSDDVDDDGAKLKVNGTSYKFADGVTLDDIVDSAGNVVGYLDEAPGVANDFYDVYLDADSKIYYAQKVTASSPMMVDELKSNKTLEYMRSGSVDLDQDDVLIVKDGKYADVEDLEKTDIVYVTEDKFGLDVYIDAYTLKNSGTFDAAMDTRGDAAFDQVKIDGKKYDLNDGFILSTDEGDTWAALNTDIAFFDDIYEEEVSFVLDKKGDVAIILTDEAAESNAIYGVIDEADTTNKGLVTKVDIMTSEGNTASYDVNTTEIEMAYNYGDKTIIPLYPNPDETIADNDYVKIILDENGDIEDLDVLDADLKTLADASKDLNKVQIDSKWYYTTSDTKVINANGADDAEVLATKDLLDYVEKTSSVANAYVKFDGNNIKFILMNDDAVVAEADDMAMVIDKYYASSKYYATVDIRGEVESYELDESGDYTAIESDVLYQYSLAGSKIDFDTASTGKFNAAVEYTVYGEVTDVDEAHNSFEVADTLANLALDDDSYVYDMTGDDPEYVNDINNITVGDYVFVIEVDPAVDDDRKGIADVVLIVDKADYPECDWENGDTGLGPDYE